MWEGEEEEEEGSGKSHLKVLFQVLLKDSGADLFVFVLTRMYVTKI